MTNTEGQKWYGFIPNLLTLSNLMSGTIAIAFAFEGQLKTAILLMFLGAIFDFFDGFVARLLKVDGELGKQLDSLADLITFGLLPATLVFVLQKDMVQNYTFQENRFFFNYLILSSSLFIPVFSAIRLAKFNIDTRQNTSFIGLPTPANALFFASLVWFIIQRDTWEIISYPNALILLAILSIIFSLLLIAPLPLFSLKTKGFGLKQNLLQYVFLAVSMAAILILGIPGIGVSVLLYILLSVVVWKVRK